jgi:hypothetical protein
VLEKEVIKNEDFTPLLNIINISKNTVVWDVTPCSQFWNIHGRFRKAYCLHLQVQIVCQISRVAFLIRAEVCGKYSALERSGELIADYTAPHVTQNRMPTSNHYRE